MVTLKKLLLLMSAMPSVAIVAMEDGKGEDSGNRDINANSNNTAVSTIATPAIQAAAAIFPFKTFNVDNCYDENEWQLLTGVSEGSSLSLDPRTKVKVYYKKPPIDEIVRSKDSSIWTELNVCQIADSDNPLLEKKNNTGSHSIIYLQKNVEKEIPPTVVMNLYAEDDLGGLPAHKYFEQIKNNRNIVATAIYRNLLAAYADSNGAVAITDISRKVWGAPNLIKHNHGSFNAKYKTTKIDKDGKKTEEFPQNIQTLTFWDENILAVRTPTCITLLNINPQERCLNHILCFEAPQKGTGLVSGGLGGLLSPSQYSYELAQNKEGEMGLIRRCGANFDRADRFALNYSLNYLHSPEVAAIWMVTNILNTTKQNVNKTTMTATFKEWYSGNKLQSLPSIVQEQYKEKIAKKAAEVGISLK